MIPPEVPYDVEIIRSQKRKKTIQARLEGNKVVVRVPARLSHKEEQAAVEDILAKLARRSTSQAVGDKDLEAKAKVLNERYLESRAAFSSIRWVSNQSSRWGSCSPHSGNIRISDRLQHVPDYVLDAVIIHELVHTFIPGHCAEFYHWANKAPRAQRAEGYLEAYSRWGG